MRYRRIFFTRVIAVAAASFFLARGVFGWTNPTAPAPTLGGGIAATADPTDASAINLGIGTPLVGEFANKLSILGGLSVGTNFANFLFGNGVAAVEGKLGIGIPSSFAATFRNIVSVVDSATGVAIGTTYAPTLSAPVNGLIVEGKVGVGTSNPVAKLDVEGGALRIGGIPQRGVWQSHIPALNIVTPIIGSSPKGGTSIAFTIGVDGLPLIAYFEGGQLKMWRCARIDCVAVPDVISTVIDANVGGLNNIVSIAIGKDGFPVFSYDNSGALKLAKCADKNCVLPITFASPASNVGQGNSLTIDSNGCPLVSYQDTTGTSALHVLKYLVTCTTAAVTPLIDSGGSPTPANGKYSSLAITSDGGSVIAYQRAALVGGNSFRIAKCDDGGCINASSWATIESGAVLTQSASLTVGLDGLPMVAYFNSNGNAVKFVKCRKGDCTVLGSLVTLASAGSDSVALTVGTDGLPLIAYHESVSGNFKLVKCGNSFCDATSAASAPNITVTLAQGNGSGSVSLAIGADGLPVVAMTDTSASGLRIVHCGNPRCLPYWTRR